MSLLQTRLVLSLALSLLWPATAFGQTPTTLPSAEAPQVQMKVDFVTVSAADLDRSGVTFDRVPFAQPTADPARTGAFLQYATSDTAVWLLQTLAHARGRVVQAPLITTTNNIPATIQVATQAPDGKGGFLSIQSGLTIRPRINSDDSISLSIALPAANTSIGAPTPESPATNLRTIRSGDVIVVAGLPFGFDRAISDRKLLVFITPTRLGTGAQTGDVEQPKLPSPPVRDTPPPTGRAVSIDVYNADLRAVVAMLERQTGLKASIRGGDNSYNPVYVHLNGASQSDVLAAIARSAGAQIIRDENGVYVFSPLPVSVRTPTPLPAAPTGGGRSVTMTP